MGLYRKVGKREEALSTVRAVLNIIEQKGISEQIGSATTFLNSATVYKAFGMPEKSIELFEKAKRIYEKYQKHGLEVTPSQKDIQDITDDGVLSDLNHGCIPPKICVCISANSIS